MPTYEYACRQCGHRLEAVQSFTDAPLIECPVCAGVLRKVFSAVGVVFKGAGFYRNDSRPAAKSDAAREGGADKADSAAAKANGKADGKPDGSSSTGGSSGGADKADKAGQAAAAKGATKATPPAPSTAAKTA